MNFFPGPCQMVEHTMIEADPWTLKREAQNCDSGLKFLSFRTRIPFHEIISLCVYTTHVLALWNMYFCAFLPRFLRRWKCFCLSGIRFPLLKTVKAFPTFLHKVRRNRKIEFWKKVLFLYVYKSYAFPFPIWDRKR